MIEAAPENIYCPNTDFCLTGPKANPKQLAFIEATYSGDYRYLSYGGAIRGGKSYVVLFVIHSLCMTYPGSKWIVVRADSTVLKATTIASFNKLIKTDRYGKWNLSAPMTFTYHNGSKIIFKPESIISDPFLNDFLGLEANGLFLEQAEELSPQMWEKALERAGSWYIDPMPHAYIFLTFNPSQKWVKQKFYEPWVNGTLQAPYYFIPSLPKDNPSVTEDQWNQWENMAERYRLQFVEGDWTDFIDTNNLWAFAFERAKHVGTPELSPGHTLYLSFDFNKNPICCSVIQWYDEEIKVLETIKLANSDIYALCQYIKVQYPGCMMMVTGDATGQSTSAMVKDNLNYYRIIMKELGLMSQLVKVPSVNPKLEDNQVLVNSLLNRYKVTIHSDKAKGLIYDMQNVKMLPDGSIVKADRNDPAQQADALDTFRYWCNTFMNWWLQRGN